MTKRYTTILYKGRWLLQKDNCNNRYAIFYKWKYFMQQVSKWYIREAYAIKKFNKLTEDNYENR